MNDNDNDNAWERKKKAVEALEIVLSRTTDEAAMYCEQSTRHLRDMIKKADVPALYTVPYGRSFADGDINHLPDLELAYAMFHLAVTERDA